MPTKSYVLACIALLVVACGGDGDSGPSNAEMLAQIAKEANDFCETKNFVKPENSKYVLPWSPGATYKMIQGNCSSSGHKDRFAYDFDLNMGDPVYASRGGTVDQVIDRFSDNDHIEGHENRVFVLHDDGSTMWYLHLMQGSAVVSIGQKVERGDLLALTGNSGNSTFAHLHVYLFRDKLDFLPNSTLPISYSNVDGLTKPDGELIEGQSYTAKPFVVFDE